MVAKALNKLLNMFDRLAYLIEYNIHVYDTNILKK